MDYVEAAKALAEKRRQSARPDKEKARKVRFATAANLPKYEKPKDAKQKDGEDQSFRPLGYLGGV